MNSGQTTWKHKTSLEAANTCKTTLVANPSFRKTALVAASTWEEEGEDGGGGGAGKGIPERDTPRLEPGRVASGLVPAA